MVIKPFLLLGLAAEYTSQRWLGSTVDRRPSQVYDISWLTKLTAPEMISHSRDMVGAHHNLSGSQTDKHYDNMYRASIALCGKK